MKIAISYPPLGFQKGVPLLSQNRQFQYFHNPTYIYPVVPAYAATMLKNAGYHVVWLDGIAEGWTYQKWLSEVKEEKPDLIMIETKTPVIKKHWQIINDLKKLKIKNYKLKIVLVGDHVTALPEESFENSQVDYVLTGGDYDFLLLNLVNHLTKGEKLEPGIWYRETPNVKRQMSKPKLKSKNYKSTGKFLLNHDLNSLPFIDRDLTRWQLYAFENGNYKYLPGTYIMAGRDCYWRKDGGCTFCSWTTLYPTWRVRKVENVLDEIGELIERYKVREVFDDTGSFPIGPWLKKFCEGMIRRGYHQKIKFGCNMRPNAITNQKVYDLMGKAGFRFILYGLESANQKSLDRLNKGEKEEDIIKATKMAKKAGLEPHVTCMVGHPWETKRQAQKTIDLTRWLFDQGYIDTLQATIIVPYPGTKLFKECEKKGWLKTKDWDKFDMSQPVMKTPMKNEEVLALTQGIYKSFITPRFLVRKITSIRNVDDLKFLWRAGKAVFGHLADFAR